MNIQIKYKFEKGLLTPSAPGCQANELDLYFVRD